jgi:glycosyltransferase involved in cell wall biosynthesis
VVILTLNERANIDACLASCTWSDDVHVLDSGSTDGTCQRAQELGAKVWHNPFAGFGAQRNWAIDNIPLKHDWVFHLDADERFTLPLVQEMDRAIRDGSPHAGFYLPNQMILMGQWIKHCSAYPAYQVRFFHKARLRFTDSGHGQREATTGTLGKLTNPYVHHNFSKGMTEWLQRHNHYSTKEAAQLIEELNRPLGLSAVLRGLLGRSMERRRTLKKVFDRLPMRSAIRFWFALTVQRGILDGRAGIAYARLLGIYEQMIAVKVREGRQGRRKD